MAEPHILHHISDVSPPHKQLLVRRALARQGGSLLQVGVSHKVFVRHGAACPLGGVRVDLRRYVRYWLFWWPLGGFFLPGGPCGLSLRRSM